MAVWRVLNAVKEEIPQLMLQDNRKAIAESSKIWFSYVTMVCCGYRIGQYERVIGL